MLSRIGTRFFFTCPTTRSIKIVSPTGIEFSKSSDHYPAGQCNGLSLCHTNFIGTRHFHMRSKIVTDLLWWIWWYFYVEILNRNINININILVAHWQNRAKKCTFCRSDCTVVHLVDHGQNRAKNCIFCQSDCTVVHLVAHWQNRAKNCTFR